MNLTRNIAVEKFQSLSITSSFAYSPAPSSMSSASSTCSSPPPASPMATLSELPSPSSWKSDCDEQTVTSSASKKRTSNHFDDDVKHFQPYVNKKPKFATKYDEMLQPLSPMTYLPVLTLMHPSKIHQPNFSLESQKQFQCLLETKTATSEIKSFLSKHAEAIDINEYNSEGRTALHQCCLDGNLSMAKLLVEFGANVKLATQEGFSTLHVAAFAGHANIMFFVLSLMK
jgi:hypothetical protein